MLWILLTAAAAPLQVARNALQRGLVGDAGPWGGCGDIAAPLSLEGRIDVLFVGTGSQVAHVPKPFREALEGQGIGVEVMASPAAARTYNVLLGEGRRVAVALIPVD